MADQLERIEAAVGERTGELLLAPAAAAGDPPGSALRELLDEIRGGPDDPRRAAGRTAAALADVLDRRVELIEIGFDGGLRATASPGIGGNDAVADRLDRGRRLSRAARVDRRDRRPRPRLVDDAARPPSPPRPAPRAAPLAVVRDRRRRGAAPSGRRPGRADDPRRGDARAVGPAGAGPRRRRRRRVRRRARARPSPSPSPTSSAGPARSPSPRTTPVSSARSA